MKMFTFLILFLFSLNVQSISPGLPPVVSNIDGVKMLNAKGNANEFKEFLISEYEKFFTKFNKEYCTNLNIDPEFSPIRNSLPKVIKYIRDLKKEDLTPSKERIDINFNASILKFVKAAELDGSIDLALKLTALKMSQLKLGAELESLNFQLKPEASKANQAEFTKIKSEVLQISLLQTKLIELEGNLLTLKTSLNEHKKNFKYLMGFTVFSFLIAIFSFFRK